MKASYVCVFLGFFLLSVGHSTPMPLGGFIEIGGLVVFGLAIWWSGEETDE